MLFQFLLVLIMGGAVLSGCASPSVPTTVSSTQGSTWVQKGYVTEVRDVTENDGRNSGIGSVAGAVTDGVAGSNFGDATGDSLSTIGGVAAGEVAGHSIGRDSSIHSSTRLTVRAENGVVNTYFAERNATFKVGDEVKIVSNNGRVTITH